MAEYKLKPSWHWVSFGDVVKLNADRCANPAAVGIERYVSTEFVEAARAELALALTTPASPAAGTWKYGIQNLKDQKPALQKLLATRDTPADIAPIILVANWLAQQLKTRQLQLM